MMNGSSAGDPGIEQLKSLDALEVRGRAYIRAGARRDTLAAAASVAALVCVFVPALGTLLAFMRPLPVSMLLSATMLLPLLAAAWVVFLRRPVPADRGAALAPFDREAGFKDRVAVSDEFLSSARADSRNGFRAAALAEAAPWLARALETPLPHPAARPAVCRALRSRAPYLVAGALLLLLALVLGRPTMVSAGSPSDDQAAAEVVDGAASRAAERGSPMPGPTLAAVIAAAIRERFGLGLGSGDAAQLQAEYGADRSTSREGAAGAQPPGTGDGPATGPSGAALASLGAGQGAAGAGGGAGGAGEGTAARDTGSGAAAGDGLSGSASVGASPSKAPSTDNTAEALNSAQPQGSPVAQTARPPQERRQLQAEAGQASANAPGGANPPDARTSPAPPRAEQGGRPAAARPGESGEQQQQSQGSKPGEGSNSAGSAQDALKRSRGLSSLLLAVPTIDRLAGTPDDGPSRSTVRRMAPQPRDADAVAAGARADQRGDAGIVARRPATLHEANLVRDYFTRDAGGQR